MGKDKTLPKYAPNQAGATAKYLRIPPRKARFVMDAVRGKYVTEALALLKFVPNFAAEAISDVIVSATANAENSRPHDPETGKQLDPLIAENLRVIRCFVDEGPRAKRVQPRAQGRAYRILKRTCHITIIVEEVEPKPRPARIQKPSRRTATAAAAAPASKPEPKAKVKEEKAAVAPVVEEKVVAPAVAEHVKAVKPHAAEHHSEAPVAETVETTEEASAKPKAE
ncbi:MAG: 50S ribosomal protein L22 [Chthonomonadales bacterium]